MKKYSILFVVLAIVSLTCAAFAQENDVAKYLGTWHLAVQCIDEDCTYYPFFGSYRYIEIHDDLSVARFSKNGLSLTTGKWYTEDDTAYIKWNNGEDQEWRDLLTIAEDGSLVAYEEDDEYDEVVVEIYTRDFCMAWGNGPIKEDAELEDFLGEWVLYATGNPVYLFKTLKDNINEGSLNVEKDNFDIDADTITLWTINSYQSVLTGELRFNNVPFEKKNGKLVGNFTDENGGHPFEITYHTENALVLTVDSGKEYESILVFVTKDDLQNAQNIYDKYKKYL